MWTMIKLRVIEDLVFPSVSCNLNSCSIIGSYSVTIVGISFVETIYFDAFLELTFSVQRKSKYGSTFKSKFFIFLGC